MTLKIFKNDYFCLKNLLQNAEKCNKIANRNKENCQRNRPFDKKE